MATAGTTGVGNQLNKLISTPNSSSLGTSSLFERFNYGVLAILMYNYAYNIIITLGHTLEITAIVIQIFIVWVIVDYFLRKAYPHIWMVTENTLWYSILVGVLEFVSWILALVLIQLILSLAMTAWTDGDLNYAESATAGFTMLFVSIPAYYNIKSVLES